MLTLYQLTKYFSQLTRSLEHILQNTLVDRDVAQELELFVALVDDVKNKPLDYVPPLESATKYVFHGARTVWTLAQDIVHRGTLVFWNKVDKTLHKNCTEGVLLLFLEQADLIWI